MGDRTNIEWADATWNPVRARNKETGKVGSHCEHVTEACRLCYAETGPNHRFGTALAYTRQNRDKVDIFLDEKVLLKPLHWRRPRTIFLHSMTDTFGEFVLDAFVHKIMAVAAMCPQHTIIVLTKRYERMLEYYTAARRYESIYNAMGEIGAAIGDPHPFRRLFPIGMPSALSNVILGTSIEDQRRANTCRDTMHTLAEQGWRTMVSYEPALGPVDWTGWDFLKLLISGGESGAGARPSHPHWHCGSRDFCVPRGIPYYFKQWGEWAPGECASHPPTRTERTATWRNGRWDFERVTPAQSAETHVDDAPDLYRLGKKAAGAMLDGREWREMPGG